MLRANRLFTVVLLVALILSACQPIQPQPTVTTEGPATSITDVAGTWRVEHPDAGEFRQVIEGDGTYRVISTDGSVLHNMGIITFVGTEMQYTSTGEGYEHCKLPNELTGRYEVMVTRVDGQAIRLTHTLLEDNCVIRRESLLSKPLELVMTGN